MLYMAVSLAFIAGGILIAYLLLGVGPQPGMTLNAVLFDKLVGGWSIGGVSIGTAVVSVTMLTEGALLFVAAQTGFVDGPRVMATMATDRWLPRRFANLSTRLVTQDGVLAIGIAAVVFLIITRANVGFLAILYSVNVFLTFTLSQLGMSVHWWRERKAQAGWQRKLMVNGIGCVFTATILVVMISLKLGEGAWMTVLMTGGLITACVGVRRHYEEVNRAVQQLEVDIVPQLFQAEQMPETAPDPNAPTAVLLVNGFSGLGLATLVMIPRLFDAQFRNVVFLSVGEVDSGLFRDPNEVQRLESSIRDDLDEYSKFARDLGFHPEIASGIGTDVVKELQRLCVEVIRKFPRSVFFAGKLILENEGFFSRFLHNQTALEIQRWLQNQGYSLVILPVKVSEPAA
jgi:hypothetical protein